MSRPAWRARRHSRHRRRRRVGQSRSQRRLCRDASARSGPARRRSRRSAHARRRADAADEPGRRSKSRSNGSRSITSRARKAICISRWFPTGPTPQPNTPTATRRSSPPRPKGSRVSICAMVRRRAASRFLLLHRRRVWNEGEARWIGWERKRGKLHELNRLLRGATDTTFIDVGLGTPAAPTGVRYVVTLDADTRLPRDAVRRLIGKMAHPLNRPRLDADGRRVVEGYAVLQPRVTPSLPIGREGSLFQRIFSSVSGIDPYASAVSDVYQDLFGEGSYAGKGIYDVDAFEAALAGRAPDSTLLSHDLFEGVFARAGLASDVEVVEEFPARYDVGAIRHHRWARGDWQLLPWIFGRGPSQSRTASSTSALPAIGRWKMLDNLRRTLSAPAAVARVAGRLDLAASRGADLDAVRRPDDRAADAHSGPRRHSAASPGRDDLEPCARARRRCPPRPDAFDADRRVPGGSGVADGRRDRPHALAPGREPAPSARMGSGRAGGDRSAPRPDRVTRVEWRARSSSAPSRRLSRWRSATGPGRWRFRSPRSGSLRPPSRAASACLPAPPLACRCPTPTRRRLGEPRAAPGGSSRLSSRRPTTCCRPTIFRTIRRRRSRIGRRRPISASISFPSSARAISAGSEPIRRSIGWRRRSRRWAACNASAAISTIGTTRAICARSTRDTCPPSTAAIWPGI